MKQQHEYTSAEHDAATKKYLYNESHPNWFQRWGVDIVIILAMLDVIASILYVHLTILIIITKWVLQ